MFYSDSASAWFGGQACMPGIDIKVVEIKIHELVLIYVSKMLIPAAA